MTAPSNANTSGLEVVAWRYTLINERGAVLFSGAMLDGPPREGPCGVDTWRAEPLVTAASAQARIADLEARVEYLRGSRDGHAAHAHSEFEARAAAEARADRLAERLRADPTTEQLEPFARKWCIDNGIDPDAPKDPHGEWPEWYDACGPFAAMWRDLARAALQQETQK